MVIKGSNFNFYGLVDSEYGKLCTATNFVVTKTADIIETTTKTTGRWKTFDYQGKLGWTGEVSLLVTFTEGFTLNSFEDFLYNLGKLQIQATDDDTVQYTGSAVITSITWDSPNGGICTGTVSLQGDGEFAKATAPLPPTTVDVDIIDQFGATIASVPAPGTYQVVRFNRIIQGGALRNEPDIIITSQDAA